MWLLRLILCTISSLPLWLMANDILPADQAFVPRIESVTDHEISLSIDIKPQYYVYRQRLFAVTAAHSDWLIDDVVLSQGSEKTDAFFGTQSVWYGGKDSAHVTITYKNPQQLSTVMLNLAYQGCQDDVICYPPISQQLPIDFSAVLSSHAMAKMTTTNTLAANQLAANNKQTNTLFKAQQTTLGKKKQPLFSSATNTNTSTLLVKANDDKVQALPEDTAFRLMVESQDNTTLILRWQIADGYYLYRDKIAITAENNQIAQVQFSDSQLHNDTFFGEQRIYRNTEAVVFVYLKQAMPQQTLNISFQGCADKGICYPVMNRLVTLDSPNSNDNIVSTITQTNGQTAHTISGGDLIDDLTQTLKNNLWLGIGLLLLAGIALALTPCVLPMLPILLGILTNQRQLSKTRSAVLSSTYVLGMATTLAVFGVVVAKTGINIQIIFQRPVWLILFAAIFMVMGLAMLGVFSLAMPNAIQAKVTGWQNRFQTNRISDVFVVGALSSLVVGPCIAPPLIAILAFIATTNDSVLGAVYLFALGVGMGLPLIIFATVVTHIPKTGELSRLMTRILAMLMFAVGLWLLVRLLPGAMGLVLWGVWLLIVAYWLWHSRFIHTYAQRATQVLAIIGLVIGISWLIGGGMGNSNPLKPFSRVQHLPFKSVHNITQLENAITNSQKPIMLDLYADWCVACQEVEHITLTDTRVIAALDNWTLLKLDITDTNTEHRQLLTKLGLIGPPALLFFVEGKEIKAARNIGSISAEDLLKTLKKYKNDR